MTCTATYFVLNVIKQMLFTMLPDTNIQIICKVYCVHFSKRNGSLSDGILHHELSE